MSKKLTLYALTVACCALAASSSAPAASPALIVGSTARAFGVRVHAATFAGDPTLFVPPTPLATSATAGHADDVATIVGPLRAPDDGSVLSDARALVAKASHSLGTAPSARGDALVAHVALLESGGVPAISADAVRAVSTSSCTGVNSATAGAEGSTLAGLQVAGQIFDATPAPNTEIPFVWDAGTPADPSDDIGVRVILNEQTPAQDGAGLIVTMIHVIGWAPSDPLGVFIDVRVAEAFSSVWCGPATPASGTNDIGIGKIVTKTTSDPLGALDGSIAYAHRGELVTWRASITNTSNHGCLIQSATDTLPEHFSFVSSAGRLTTASPPAVDGQALTWTIGGPLTLGPGATISELLTARVANDAPYGTYTNLMTVFDSTCSERTSGLAGPVTIVPRPSSTVLSKTIPPKSLPATGVEDVQFAALLCLAAAAALRRTLVRRA